MIVIIGVIGCYWLLLDNLYVVASVFILFVVLIMIASIVIFSCHCCVYPCYWFYCHGCIIVEICKTGISDEMMTTTMSYPCIWDSRFYMVAQKISVLAV